MKREQNVFIRAYPRFIRQKKERIFSRMSRGQSTDKLEINGLVTQPITDELLMNYGWNRTYPPFGRVTSAIHPCYQWYICVSFVFYQCYPLVCPSVDKCESGIRDSSVIHAYFVRVLSEIHLWIIRANRWIVRNLRMKREWVAYASLTTYDSSTDGSRMNCV